jgi:RNA polymerase sigma-70 factor (ECF subfamily)
LIQVSRPQLVARQQQGPSDAALVVAARAGEEWARESIYRRYAGLVFGLAHRLLGRDHEIDDLVQECFAQALANLHRLDDPQALAAWLSSLVVRTTHKMLRRRTIATRLGLRRPMDPLDADALVSPNAPADVQAELRAIYAIIERLPARARIALVLRRVEGMSQEEVARAMGVSVSTAKRLLADGEQRLQAALRDPSPRSSS